MKSLVGYTGFVGSNITSKSSFDGLYNSKNIRDAFGTKPDLLVYSGIRAEKYLANKDPEKDYENIKNAIKNVKMINPKMLVLISTIDVYKNPLGVNEDTEIVTEGLHAYGLNRYIFEKWAEEAFEKHLIIRLPGLYGKNIKKNFIYDMINIIPLMLNTDKFNELSKSNSLIPHHYGRLDNGFYKCNQLNNTERIKLKEFFNNIGFSALNFTDSRASFQFYNLNFLWEHIQTALTYGIKKLNLSAEPVTAAELYKYIKDKEFINKISEFPAIYNITTKYNEVFGCREGYIFDKAFVLKDIKRFVEDYKV